MSSFFSTFERAAIYLAVHNASLLDEMRLRTIAGKSTALRPSPARTKRTKIDDQPIGQKLAHFCINAVTVTTGDIKMPATSTREQVSQNLLQNAQ